MQVLPLPGKARVMLRGSASGFSAHCLQIWYHTQKLNSSERLISLGQYYTQSNLFESLVAQSSR